MPNKCASGNMRPQSTAIASAPYSISIMFKPNSPRPPSGMIFKVSINGLHDTSWRRHRRSRQDFLISVKWLVGLQISCDDFLNLRAQTAQSTWAKFVRHDRRTYRYIDRAGLDAPFTSGKQFTRAVDGHRHDGCFGFQRQEKAAAFERQQFAVCTTGAFGKYHHRNSRRDALLGELQTFQRVQRIS